MRSLSVWGLILGLFVGSALLRAPTTEMRKERASTAESVLNAPNSVFGLFFLGAFKPLYMEYLWEEASQARAEGRVWDLLEAFQRLSDLDPSDVHLAWFQVKTLAFDIAQRESEPSQRWQLYLMVLKWLDRAAARRPDSFILEELRIRILFQLIGQDQEMSRRYRRRFRVSPLEAALERAGGLHARWPSNAVAFFLYRRCAEEATEWLLNHGRIAAAAQCYEDLASLDEEGRQRFPRDVPARDLARHRFFADATRTLGNVADWTRRPPALKDGPGLAELLDRVAHALAEGLFQLADDEETQDAAWLHALIVRTVRLAQGQAILETPRGALPLLEPLRRICSLAEGRLGPGTPYYSESYVDELGIFLRLDDRLLKGRRGLGEVPIDLEASWSRKLETLDRMVTRRAGRSDGFMRDLLASRAH